MNAEEKKLKVLRRAHRILEIVQNKAPSTSHVHDIEITSEGYAEPGYSAKHGIIALGNWNDDDRYDKLLQMRVKTCFYPSRVMELFEKMGIECEWSDELTTCYDCGKVIRTQPDSYVWTPSYVIKGDSFLCNHCAKEDEE